MAMGSCKPSLVVSRALSSHLSRSDGAKVNRSTRDAWRNMIKRCTSSKHKAYADYGGRGITVCFRWRFFSLFVSDMGQKPDGMSLDRIDNNGDYKPSNCRWATPSEQQRNKRSTKLTPEDVEWIKAGKDLVTQIMLAEALGVTSSTISLIHRGLKWI